MKGCLHPHLPESKSCSCWAAGAHEQSTMVGFYSHTSPFGLRAPANFQKILRIRSRHLPRRQFPPPNRLLFPQSGLRCGGKQRDVGDEGKAGAVTKRQGSGIS
jgi:hypothetical protein